MCPPVPRPLAAVLLPPLQEMVYQATTKSLIKGVISGYNATVFAYGPTGEGEPAQWGGPDARPP